MKKAIFYALIIALVVMFSATHHCHAANLLVNPGFEQGDFPPDNWADWSGSESESLNDGVAGFSAPRQLKHSGRKAVGKILYGSGSRWGGFSQAVKITGGKIFKATGWIMSSKNDVALGKGAEAFIEVKFLDSSEGEIKKVRSNSVMRPVKWTKISCTGLVPHKASQAVFSFMVTGPKGSRGKVFFDDASLNLAD